MSEVARTISQLGRYRDLTLVGQGGMGAVYRALDPSLDRRVAIKLMHDKSPPFVARFRREARAIARLSHPHIVQVHDFGEDPEGRPYFVMELCSGRSLEALLQERGPLPVDLSLRLLRQAAAGLHAAHTAGIVHRDIKPANLLLDSEDRLKLVDFGIARMEEGGQALTQTGAIFGTPLYMAPEMLKGDPIDGRTDIYALGLTAFHLLTGHPPFVAPTAASLAMKQLTDPLPDLSREVAQAPPALCRLIAQMAEKDPAARVPTCEELERRLAAIGAAADRPSARSGQRAPARAWDSLGAQPTGYDRRRALPGSRHMIIGSAACFAVALGVLLVVFMTHMPDKRRTAVALPDRAKAPSVASAAPSSAGPAGPSDAAGPSVNTGSGPASGPLRVAVLKFKNLGGDRDLDLLTEGIGETVLTVLSDLQSIRLVERNQVDQALSEIDFGQTRYVDKATAAALGRIAGAEVAIQGGYQRAGGQIRVTARFVRIATGEILDTLVLTRPSGALFDVQDRVAADLRKRLSALAAR